MDEREEFLRDRVRPRPPDAPVARPPGAPTQGSQFAPPGPPPPRAALAPGYAGYPPGRLEPSVAPPAPPAARLPDQGWRRIVRLATFGLVKLGPSPAQLEEARFEAAVRNVLRGNYKVGVLGKGGVGKTSVAVCVGSQFAELRQDRVVAVDADTAFGRLSGRTAPDSAGSFWDLTSDRNVQSFAEVAARMGRSPAGLYVLSGAPASDPRRVLDPAVYREASLRLDRHFTISVIDCGSTMESPVTQEVLRDLDALIVVSSPWADGASAAARTLEWLSARGMSGLLRRTIVVLNDSDGHADRHTRELLAREFVEHGQPVVQVPFDPHLRPGGVIDLSEIAPATRRKLLQITATVSGYFAARTTGARHRAPQ